MAEHYEYWDASGWSRFRRLWSRSVGLPGYDKRLWLRMERVLEQNPEGVSAIVDLLIWLSEGESHG